MLLLSLMHFMPPRLTPSLEYVCTTMIRVCYSADLFAIILSKNFQN